VGEQVAGGVGVIGRSGPLESRSIICAQRFALSNLLQKYFPQMKSGEEYRPITDEELKRTSVYIISIESWRASSSHWPEQADQSEEWSPLNTIAVDANAA
jgi:hypothetical protein